MNKGIYALVVYLGKDSVIGIGKLGRIQFKKGHYCYVGSALNNLDKRIGRHLSTEKKIKWHIDHLLKNAFIKGIVKAYTNKGLECVFSKKIEKVADSFVRGFGCSDCKCSSHLYYFKKNPMGKIYGIARAQKGVWKAEKRDKIKAG